MAVKIVSDSGSDIPAQWIDTYDITLVPVVLRFGDREVNDSPETRVELWERITHGLPCETSGPSIGAYEAAYAPLVVAGDDVLCITLTGAHSGTHNSAWAAAQTFPGRIEVLDGRSISLGYGLQVREAAQRAAAGQDLATIVSAVQEMQNRITIRFFLETLENAARGGRLEALMPVLARLGQALNIRAILTINPEGRISLVGPVGGWQHAVGAKRRYQAAATGCAGDCAGGDGDRWSQPQPG